MGAFLIWAPVFLLQSLFSCVVSPEAYPFSKCHLCVKEQHTLGPHQDSHTQEKKELVYARGVFVRPGSHAYSVMLARSSRGWKAEVNVSARFLSLEASRCDSRVDIFSSCLYVVTPAYVFVLIPCVCLGGRSMWVWLCKHVHAGICVHVFTCIW